MPDQLPDSNSENASSEYVLPSLLTLMLTSWSFALWVWFAVATFVVGTPGARQTGYTFVVIGSVLAVLALISHGLPSSKTVKVETGNKVEASKAVSDELNPFRR